MAWLPKSARIYAIVLSLWVACVGLYAFTLHAFGSRAASFFSFLLLLLMLGSAWLGYGPGVLICVLSVVVAPRIVLPNRAHHFDPINLGLVLVIMLLISAVGNSKRRGAATLEQRVADRTRALLEQQEQVSEQAKLLNLTTDAILAMDDAGVIRFWNKGAEELYGWTSREAIGRKAADLLHTTFPEPLPEILATLQSTGAWQGELVQTRKSGSRVTGMSRWAMRRDRNGQPCGWLEINTDITGRRRMEEQLRQAQRMEAVGRLAGGISHDFNNLLTVINGYAVMALEKQPAGTELHATLQEISAAGERAAELTRGLLSFSRQPVLRPTPVDLNSVVAGMEKMLRRVLGEHIDLTTIRCLGLWEVCADRSQLEQIVMNLAVNARDAMPSGGRLTIETSNAALDDGYCGSHLGLKPGEYVMLAVSDTGHGMDSETQAHIFEPFFTTKEAGKGTGLGLATVYGIVQHSGGAISVYSEVGQGTTFKAYLPRLCAAVLPAETQGASIHITPSYPATETVLLVEDDESLRRLTAAMLTRQGFQVITVNSAAEALKHCETAKGCIDLVLTDLVMPNMNGHQLGATIRQRYPGMKLVFMSGYTEHTIFDQTSIDTNAHFVSKPFSAAALLGAINAALGRDADTSASA